jgi:hypothetical protein
MQEQCYMCNAPATTREHVPPKSFHPEAYRTGLITVPSCERHNLGNSMDVEYVRNVLSMQMGVNAAGGGSCVTTMRCFDKKPNLLERTVSTMEPIMYEGSETGAFRVDLQRLDSVMRAIAFGLYRFEKKATHEGDFQIFAAGLGTGKSWFAGQPDGYDERRRRLAAIPVTQRDVPQPEVFRYGTCDFTGEGTYFRLEFYGAFVVHAMPLPYRLSAHIYVPATRDLLMWTRLRH